MRIIEKTIILRTLNYLRLRHEYSLWYNAILPIIFTTLILMFFSFSNNLVIYGNTGILSELSYLLALLIPFYVASMAAVSTFQGSQKIDEPMMNGDVTLEVLYKGKFKVIKITWRHFLSMLFGYCSFLSLILYFFNMLALHTNKVIKNITGCSLQVADYAENILLTLFVFMIMNLVTTTILGLYFISDKIHRL